MGNNRGMRLQRNSTAVTTLLALLALLMVTGALYHPGARGPYLMDDEFTLTDNRALLAPELTWAALREAALSREAGPLKRPVAMASFALNYHFAGSNDVYSIKLTNILLHLLTALGVFLLSRRLLFYFRPARETGLNWVALFIAALWALHPLHVSTVLYAVQRMTELAALFSVYAALAYVQGREKLLRGEAAGFGWIGGALIVGGGLATLSKESGALLPVLLLVLEAGVFRFAAHPRLVRRTRWMLGGTLLLPTLLILGYLVSVAFLSADGYANRTFTPSERLLTECRALFFYLRLILLPDIGAMGLFHDDFGKSVSLTDPLSTPFALLGVVALFGLALYALRRPALRALGFGALWFLAGHLLESTVIGLELVFEHRNYLPSFGPVFALGYYLARAAARLTRVRPALRGLLLAALVALFADGLYQRVAQWSSLERFALAEATQHPRSARAAFQVGYVFSTVGAYDDARRWLDTAVALKPDETGYAIAALTLTYATGATPDESALARIEHGLRTNPLNDFVVLQVAGLIRLTNAADRPAYAAATERVLRAFIAALLEHRVYADPAGRARAFRLLGALALKQGKPGEAVHALERARAEWPGGAQAVELRLALATVYLADNTPAKAEGELARLEGATLTAAQQATLAQLRARLVRANTKHQRRQ